MFSIGYGDINVKLVAYVNKKRIFFMSKDQGTVMSEEVIRKVKKNDEGKLLEECDYLGELMHGKRIIWHPSGVKISETDFVQGVMQGEHISWYLTGQIALKASVVGGDYHGLLTSYWPNGEKREAGHLDKGERVGIFKSWSDSGELLVEKNHDQ